MLNHHRGPLFACDHMSHPALDLTQNIPALVQDLGYRITVLYGLRKKSIQAQQTYPKPCEG